MQSFFKALGKSLVILLFLFLGIKSSEAQEKDTLKFVDRIFMPSIQMGYIHHLSNELSGGLFIQTSLEYQSPINLFVRINYDDFDTNYQLDNFDPQNSVNVIQGQASFSELIGGVGYRQKIKKSYILTAVQAGARFYGFPFADEENGVATIGLQGKNIPVLRYSLGYEYEVIPRVFIVVESFAGHVLQKRDYWRDTQWAFGVTLGITATLF